jgi:hypothetical protein
VRFASKELSHDDYGPNDRPRLWCSGLALAGAVTASCSKETAPPAAATPAVSASAAVGANGEKYPAPRWPSYFKTPKSVDELMPAARMLVRNQSGLQGKGMGILREGEKVLIVAADEADPMVMEAVTKALRRAQDHPVYQVHLRDAGNTKEQAKADRERRLGGQDIKEAGVYQATAWITGQFPNPSQPAKWLKDKDRKTFAALFPGRSAEAVLKAGPQKPRGEAGGGGADADTGQTEGGAGGGRAPGAPRRRWREGAKAEKEPGLRDALRGRRLNQEVPDRASRRSRRVLGQGRQHGPPPASSIPCRTSSSAPSSRTTSTTSSRRCPPYPGDVWQLAEEQLLEPLVYVDRLEITDPEGTNLQPTSPTRWRSGGRPARISADTSTCSRTRRPGASATRS